jgi:hypothetical protein
MQMTGGALNQTHLVQEPKSRLSEVWRHLRHYLPGKAAGCLALVAEAVPDRHVQGEHQGALCADDGGSQSADSSQELRRQAAASHSTQGSAGHV